MRSVFPDNFEDAEQETQPKRKKPSVVAAATRSTTPRSVKLTKSQVAIAKRLGVPLEEYAKQAAIELKRERENG